VVAAPPAEAAQPAVPAAAPADSDTIAKAREAMRQKMQEIESQPASVPGQTAPPVAAAPAGPEFPSSADSAAIAKARQAMEQEMQQLASAPPEPNPPWPPGTPPKPTKVNPMLDFPKLQAPPLPISTEQQQQLSVLLQKYRADQISPEEYHAERAKILGEK